MQLFSNTHAHTHTHIRTHTSLAVSGHYICQVGALNCAIFKKEKHHHYTHWLRYWFSSLYNLQKKKKKTPSIRRKSMLLSFLIKKSVFMCWYVCVFLITSFPIPFLFLAFFSSYPCPKSSVHSSSALFAILSDSFEKKNHYTHWLSCFSAL